MNYTQLEIYELDKRQEEFAQETNIPSWVAEGMDYKYGYCENDN